MDLTGKRVWVVGHRGMVGRALVRRLEREDCQILTATRWECELVRQERVEHWMAEVRPQVVIAAAEVGGVTANDSYAAELLYDNLMIEANLIDAVRRAGVEKLLFLGSSCIYPKLAPQPMAEDCLLTGSLEPTNQWYAIAKIAGIKLCQAYRRQWGCDFISAVPTNLYGPGDNFELLSNHVAPALIAEMHAAKIAGADEVEIRGTGRSRCELLHIDDLADACIHLLQVYSGELPVNVGGQDLSIAELAEKVRVVVGFEGRLRYNAERADGTPRKLLDTSRLTALGWRPKIALEDGLADAYRWYRASNGARCLLEHRLYGAIKERLAGGGHSVAYGGRAIDEPIPANEMIRTLVSHGTSSAIGKIGANELLAVHEYLALNDGSKTRVKPWLLEELHVTAGVFPPTQDTLVDFAVYFLDIVGRMDLLVAWSRPGERAVLERYCPNANLVSMMGLDPFYVNQPWTAALAEKAVLVASPFVDSIGRQYLRRQLVWPDRPAMLPEFDLQLMRLPFSDGLVKSTFDNWFHALDALVTELHSRTFDVLLVGGGAFSLPLAVAAKKMGRIGIHLGGSTQVLFGVRGARWDNHPLISALYNDHWVRPSLEETPLNHKQVEAGAYW